MVARRLATLIAALTTASTLAACKFEPGPFVRRDAGSDASDSGGGGDSGMSDVMPDTPMTDASVDAMADAVVLTCPTTYILTDVGHVGSKYKYVSATADWAAAEMDCEDDGGGTFLPAHLIVLDDDAERLFALTADNSDQWVGVSDVNAEGTLQAVTDQASPFFGAATGNMQSKDCLILNQNETTLEACTAMHSYMCECDRRAANPNNF
jgi:hypothetical protein